MIAPVPLTYAGWRRVKAASRHRQYVERLQDGGEASTDAWLAAVDRDDRTDPSEKGESPMAKNYGEVDHPILRAFLSSLPADSELAEHEAAYRAAAEEVAATRRRAADFDQRLEDIDRALFDALGKERQALLEKRQTLLAEMGATPARIRHFERRRNAAALHWLARVWLLARADLETAAAELAPFEAAARDGRKEFDALERRKRSWELSEEDMLHGQRAILDRRAELRQQAAPAMQRRDRAAEAVQVAEARAQFYHPDVHLSQPERFEAYIDEAMRARTQARGLVPV